MLDLLGSSWCALLLAERFIRQARAGCDTHLKVLIRYHSTMSAIFIYLCHLIRLVVISFLCSFICFPSSSCPLQVCYSGILHLPFPFFSLCMVWDESWLFDHTYRESVCAVIWYEAPKPVKWARAAVQTSAVHCDSLILGTFYCVFVQPCLWFIKLCFCLSVVCFLLFLVAQHCILFCSSFNVLSSTSAGVV